MACPRSAEDGPPAQRLLAGCFYTYAKSFAGVKLFQRILRDAKRIGAAERRSVSLRNTTKIARLLIRSASKLKSIEDIVRLENETLAGVAHGDPYHFIRRADFPADETDTNPSNAWASARPRTTRTCVAQRRSDG
jgi:hypothetical protein